MRVYNILTLILLLKCMLFLFNIFFNWLLFYRFYMRHSLLGQYSWSTITCRIFLFLFLHQIDHDELDVWLIFLSWHTDPVIRYELHENNLSHTSIFNRLYLPWCLVSVLLLLVFMIISIQYRKKMKACWLIKFCCFSFLKPNSFLFAWNILINLE